MTADRGPAPSRRGGHGCLIAVVVLLVVLVAGFVVVDRIAVSVAQDRVATRLADQRPFAGRPTVRIHGFPFLTQAVGGRYSDIEVSGTGQELAGMSQIHVDAALHGAHIPLSAVGSGVKSVPVDRVVVTITAPLTELARAAGVPGLTLTANNGAVEVRAPVALPGLGTVTITGSAHLSVSAGALTGSLSQLKSSTGALPDAVAAAARRALSIRVALPNIGFDSAVASVRAEGTNIVLSGSARNVTLR